MAIALATLAIGLPAALFVLWPLLRRERESPGTPADDLRASLEAEKLLALRGIRELVFDHQAGHLAEEDYAELRARDEARAAVILKRLDELAPEPAPAPRATAPAAAAAPASWSRQPLVLGGAAVGLVAFGVVLGVLVVRYAQPEPPTSAQAPMTAMPGMAAMPGAPESPEPGGAARGGAESGSPRPIPKEMLEGMLRAAHTSLDEGRYQEAIAAYKAVLKRDPENVDAITHLGVMLAIAGHADGAVEAFDRALAIQPDYPHALWDKARVLSEARQDYAGAIALWERFVRVAPPGQDREQALARIREAKARLAAGARTPAPGNPKP